MREPSSTATARWMALWLTNLPIDRLKRIGAAPPEGRPFAVYAKSGNAFALTAVDRTARGAGLLSGMALADARAIRPDLVAAEAQENADRLFLDSLGAWCERFSPTIVLDPPDGLFIDIEGCAHLFGGEAALLADAQTRLRAQGVSVRGAIAGTPGAAYALARFGPANAVTDEPLTALADLPVAALRLEESATALLKRLGLRTIGQIAEAPRAPFSARTGQAAMMRLDQALGRAAEALTPRRPPPPVFAFRRLLEPITTLEAILILAEALCGDLCARLHARGLGVRFLRLMLFGVDGKARALELGLSRPEVLPAPMLRLLKERLAASAERFDAAFGFEAARLEAVEVGPIFLRSTDLAPTNGFDRQAEARLVDALAARLGCDCAGKLAVGDRHAPERSSARVSFETPVETPPPPDDGVMRRPLALFAPAQPIEALATVPDGPPVRFRWRRLARTVVRAEGPERIMPNWLKAPDSKGRDYYRVEDERGRRYWIYREGFFGEGEAPRWFMHGLFP